jgi:hypothetical protein
MTVKERSTVNSHSGVPDKLLKSWDSQSGVRVSETWTTTPGRKRAWSCMGSLTRHVNLSVLCLTCRSLRDCLDCLSWGWKPDRLTEYLLKNSPGSADSKRSPFSIFAGRQTGKISMPAPDTRDSVLKSLFGKSGFSMQERRNALKYPSKLLNFWSAILCSLAFIRWWTAGTPGEREWVSRVLWGVISLGSYWMSFKQGYLDVFPIKRKNIIRFLVFPFLSLLLKLFLLRWPCLFSWLLVHEPFEWLFKIVISDWYPSLYPGSEGFLEYFSFGQIFSH